MPRPLQNILRAIALLLSLGMLAWFVHRASSGSTANSAQTGKANSTGTNGGIATNASTLSAKLHRANAISLSSPKEKIRAGEGSR
jgi:hypothetical protein